MEHQKKPKSLVLFRQACMSAVNDKGALQLGNLHVELGLAGGLEFACAQGLGSRLVPGVRFKHAAVPSISHCLRLLQRSWGEKPQFEGQTAEASLALVKAGLLDCLFKLDAAYNEMREHLLRVPEVTARGSVLQFNELFLTEHGDIFGQVEFGARRTREEAIAFLGDMERCMHHQVGWRPALLGFCGYGLEGAHPEVVRFIEASEADQHAATMAVKEQLLQPPPDFHGLPIKVSSLLVAA